MLITINTLIFGFVIFLPQFFLRQGLTIANSLGYTLVLSIASLLAEQMFADAFLEVGFRAEANGWPDFAVTDDCGRLVAFVEGPGTAASRVIS